MDIEEISPAQEQELGSMSIEQLEQRVATEEGAAPVEGQATGQAQAGGEAAGQTQNTAPEADAPPKWFTQYAENMKRELGSLRSLQGLSDKLPKLVEQQLNQRLQAMQQAQRNANLSPEDQEAQAQLQTQQDNFAKYVREQSRTEFQEAAKDYLPVLQELIEERKDSSYKNQTLSMIKEIIPEGADETWQKMWGDLAKDIDAGKEGAKERFDELSASPHATALAMIQVQRAQVQGQAQQVTTQRQNSARQAAQGPKSSAVQSSGKKSLAEMSPAEMQEFAEKDPAAFEAAIPEV